MRHPAIVFFQTGSNDYVSLKGTAAEKVAACMDYKKQMFAEIHKQLPVAKLVVMSSLLLPAAANTESSPRKSTGRWRRSAKKRTTSGLWTHRR